MSYTLNMFGTKANIHMSQTSHYFIKLNIKIKFSYSNTARKKIYAIVHMVKMQKPKGN